MVTVKTQKELKEAIKAKESPIVPGNRRMAVLLSVIAALFELTEKNGERPTAKEVVSIILAEGFGGAPVGAIAESTLIILVISSLVAAVLIVAICKGQKVSVKWDKKKRVFCLETK